MLLHRQASQCLRVCALGVLTAGCTTEIDSDNLQRLALALDGPIETGLPAVGTFDAPGDCTGTLIDPSWVITAAHCSKDDDPLEIFRRGVGPDPAQMSAHPLRLEGFKQPGADIELVRLVEPILDVAPIELAREVPVGQTCKAVGYGWGKDETTGNDVTGIKRSKDVVIVEADDDEVRIDSQLRSGDSGGPLLCGDRVTAVASQAGGIYHRVDPEWIARTIADPRQPEPGDPDPAPFTPEQSLRSADGELCPAGSVTFDDGSLYTLGGGYDADGDGRVTCKIELSVTVPAGKTFEAPDLCITLYSDEPLPGPATLKYSFPGFEFGDDAWDILQTPPRGLNPPSVIRCDTLMYSPNTCDNPSQPHTLTLTVDVDVPLAEDSVLNTLGFQTKLSDADTTWSDCN